LNVALGRIKKVNTPQKCSDRDAVGWEKKELGQVSKKMWMRKRFESVRGLGANLRCRRRSPPPPTVLSRLFWRPEGPPDPDQSGKAAAALGVQEGVGEAAAVAQRQHVLRKEANGGP